MYNEVIKRAMDTYRLKNPELINAIARKVYYKRRHTEAYMAMNRERVRNYRAKQKLSKLQKTEETLKKIDVDIVVNKNPTNENI